MSEALAGIRPLDGIRVLDVATFIAAPFCGTLLAEFGAEVIKVELPKLGDPLRKFGTASEIGLTFPWLSEARNKKSVTLDLRKPEGAALFKRLAEKADVVCENFQTGTLENWGLGYETLKAVNPGVVMLRVTGYGQTGPFAGRPGFARIGQAFGGLSVLAGYPDRAPVTPGSSTIADYMSGLFGAYGVLLALRARERTGEGQVIDIGLYESVFRILDELVPNYQRTGYVRQRMGPGTINVVPHSHYPTKDGHWVAIACTTDKIFERLARLMGRPDLAGDGPWGNYRDRDRERDKVDAFVGEWSSRYDMRELLDMCDAAQVPCGPLHTVDTLFEDPQFKARENIALVADPRLNGPLAVPNVVPKLTDTPGRIDHLGPQLGEHNREIYGDLLGLSDTELVLLAKQGVI
jgi:crotonobetainyl-CoA:carnitine CoA-transferase CaiB-like acyl-CoA transferase